MEAARRQALGQRLTVRQGDGCGLSLDDDGATFRAAHGSGRALEAPGPFDPIDATVEERFAASATRLMIGQGGNGARIGVEILAGLQAEDRTDLGGIVEVHPVVSFRGMMPFVRAAELLDQHRRDAGDFRRRTQPIVVGGDCVVGHREIGRIT